MQRSRLGQLALASAAVLAATLTSVATPALAATDSDIPTFSEFHSQTFKDVDNQYIVNGDEPVSTTSDLKTFYESMVGSSRRPPRTASWSTPSAVVTTSGPPRRR